MDLAERVGWPREPQKWDLLLALGRGYCIRNDNGALDAMVVMPAHEGATFVAMMVVDPAAQSHGLGRRLLSHAMRTEHAPFMLYATERGRRLYEGLGFREVDRARKYIGTPRGMENVAHVRAAEAAEHESMIDSDARAFGARRPRLMR